MLGWDFCRLYSPADRQTDKEIFRRDNQVKQALRMPQGRQTGQWDFGWRGGLETLAALAEKENIWSIKE
jgi:hypothetical protein